MNVRLCLQALAIAMAISSISFAATVVNTNDSGPGSLRDAVAITPPGGTVDFALSGCPCTIILTSGELIITKNLSIVGPGADQLAISGNDASRVFRMHGPGFPDPNPNITVSIEGITIKNGRAGAYPPFPGFNGYGGGIFKMFAHLTVRNCVISNNTAAIFRLGGGIASVASDTTIIGSTISNNSGAGAGIFSETASTLTVTDSTIADNVGGLFTGGGIYCQRMNLVVSNSTIARNTGDFGSGVFARNSTVNISTSTIEGNTTAGDFGYSIVLEGSVTSLVNSTISGNRASASCAGIYNLNADFSDQLGDRGANRGPAMLTLTNTTMTDNLGPGNCGGITTEFEKGYPTMTLLQNSIVAGNSSVSSISDVRGGPYSSSGYNLVGNAGSVTAFDQPGDQAGTPQSPIDPRLELLAMNGGPTRTHALRLSSPALDKGKAFGSITDQRGLPRPNDNPDVANAPGGDGSDIGAFEVQFPVSGTVSIAGRVNFSGMIARSRGFVTLTDPMGSVLYAPVKPSGHYRFTGVPLGRALTVGLMAKNWTIEPQTLFIADPITDLDLNAFRSP